MRAGILTGFLSYVNNETIDVDAQAYITLYSVSEINQIIALDYLCKQLKSGDFWDDVYLINPFCNSLVGNIKEISRPATVVSIVGATEVKLNDFGAYNFGAQAATGNRNHIDLNWNPRTYGIAGNISLWYWAWRNQNSLTSYDMGGYDATYGMYFTNMSPFGIDSVFNLTNSSKHVAIANSGQIGLIGQNILSNNLNEIVINGEVVGSTTTATDGILPNQNMSLNIINNLGKAPTAGNQEYGIAIIAKGIANDKLASFNTIIRNFIDLKTKKITLFYGDSITNGVGATVDSSCYRSLLTTSLTLRATNFGVNGRMMSNGRLAALITSFRTIMNPYITALTTTYPFAVGNNNSWVSLFFGVNDIGFNFAENTVELFETQYTEVVNYFINVLRYDPSKIIMVSPSYVSQTGWNGYLSYGIPTAANETRALQFIEKVYNLATLKGCNYV